MNPLIQTWLLQSFIIFLTIGALAGMLLGAILLFRPQILRNASARLNRWVSTRHLDQALERTVSLDPWFYRHRHISGTLTLLGALYVVYFFTVKMGRAEMVAGFARHFKIPPALIASLIDALALSALLGALFAAAVSLFVLFRPSMLRGFEQQANRWVSLRRALKPAETQHKEMDEYVLKHNYPAGILLLLGGGYVLAFMLTWLGH